MKIAKLNIEGYIGGSDIQSMFSGEETFSLSKLKKFLDNLESDVTDIHVFINSGGGSVTEGWAIYDKLRASGKSITTIGEGIVGSIATVIYMAGTTRKLHENSKFFIHNPYWQANAATPMEGTDLIALGEDLINEQNKILEFYSNCTSTEISSIEPLMNKATDLTATQAVDMGFAHSIINEFVNLNHYKLVAMVDIKDKTNKKQIQMDNTNEVLAAINKLGSMFSKAFKGKVLNMDVKAVNESGEAVQLFIESETEDLTGKKVYVVDADGNQVEAPNGVYVDEKGKSIKVEGGLVVEVMDNSLEEMKAKLEAAIAENESLKASVSEKTNEAESIKAEFSTIEKEFQALKKVVIGANAKFEKGSQTFAAKEVEEDSNLAYANELAKNFKRK